MTDCIPLIYTSKGNVPIESLEYKTGFDFDQGGCTFWEEHSLDGEIVRRSAHRYALPIQEVTVKQGLING